MPAQVEKTIPVVKCNQPANFPFCAQVQATENWSTVESAVTLEAAMEAAKALVVKYPKLPVRVEHSTGGPSPVHFLPVFKRREGSEKPYRHALWSGVGEPPAVGARVTLTINNLGPATVTGYAVEGGYLGVMVKIDEATRPAWHKKQNPENQPSLAFGAELKED
jgi:hypothetical protein